MHLAGQKIRQWREAHDPPLSAEEFGERYGDPWPSRTVYGWEAKGKIARAPVQKKLAELGVCEPSDWLEPVSGVASDVAKPAKGRARSKSSAQHPFYDMRSHGFVRVATSTPHTRTADVTFNVEGILSEAQRAHKAGVDLVVYPELCVSSYAIDDLYLQNSLLDAAERGVGEIIEASAEIAPVLLIGAPLRHNGRIYNCALAVVGGRLLGVIPKSFLPNYREYYEKRWFAHGREIRGKTITVDGEQAPFGTDLIFAAENLPGFKLFVEICEDYWAPNPPSTLGALAGATVLANLSASNITIGKSDERHLLARAQSARAVAAYVYSASGHGESTTDLAWDGQGMTYELGDLLAESERFSLDAELSIADVDCERLLAERMRMQTFNDAAEAAGRPEDDLRTVEFTLGEHADDRGLIRPIRRFPFVPNRQHKLDEDCYEAFNIQVDGLMRRLEATHAKIDGDRHLGRARFDPCADRRGQVRCDRLGLPRSIIRGYTMPGFGTSDGIPSPTRGS